jgi:uncharacterized protein
MLIKVKVFTSSKKESLVFKSRDHLEIKIREKPLKGQANKKVFEILSFYFKVPKSNIRMIKGFKERNKIFEIRKEAN